MNARSIAGVGLVLFGLGASFGQAQAPAARPPLVACEAGKDVPCIVLATKIADIAGIWKQYLGNPALAAPGRMGYIRYSADGSFVIADTPENTRAPFKNWPSGTVSFDGPRMTLTVKGEVSLPECRTGVYEVRVIRLGDRPVGLQYTVVDDKCVGRQADLDLVLPYAGPAD